jgi:hypothetical protein
MLQNLKFVDQFVAAQDVSIAEDIFRLFFFGPTGENQVPWSARKAKINATTKISKEHKIVLDGAFLFYPPQVAYDR